MKEKIGKILVAGAMVLASMISSGVTSNSVYAGTCAKGVSEAKCNKICKEENLKNLSKEQKNAAGCDTASGASVTNNILNVINVAIGFIGLVAVVVIVFAGQRFLSATGDPGRIKQAKDMILYAGVALVIAALAFAIVNFVAGVLVTSANMNQH